jgi:tetratricopeptide (TPR) repeat protein
VAPGGPLPSDRDPAALSELLDAREADARGDPAAAIAAWEALTARHPDSWSAWRGLQDARRRVEDPAAWRAAYRAAAQAQPEDALGWYLLGRAEIEDSDAAARSLQTAQSLAPGQGWPSVALAWLHAREGDFLGAVETYETALERAPRSVVLHRHLGLQYLDLKLYVDAERHLEEARQLTPDDPEVLAWLGRARLGLRRHEEARELIEAARALEPRLPAIWPPLAELLLHERRAAEADEAYRRGLLLGNQPDTGLAARIRAARLVERSGQ